MINNIAMKEKPLFYSGPGIFVLGYPIALVLILLALAIYTQDWFMLVLCILPAYLFYRGKSVSISVYPDRIEYYTLVKGKLEVIKRASIKSIQTVIRGTGLFGGDSVFLEIDTMGTETKKIVIPITQYKKSYYEFKEALEEPAEEDEDYE